MTRPRGGGEAGSVRGMHRHQPNDDVGSKGATNSGISCDARGSSPLCTVLVGIRFRHDHLNRRRAALYEALDAVVQIARETRLVQRCILRYYGAPC